MDFPDDRSRLRPWRPGGADRTIPVAEPSREHHQRRSARRSPGGIDSLDAALDRVKDTAGLALVAERDAQVVGHLFVAVEGDAEFVRAQLRSHAHISEFLVREAARGSGVGRALFAEAERFAAARDLQRLTVSALSGNLMAPAAYQQFGFAPYSIDLIKAL